LTIVADRVDAVIGVDTHTDTHTAAVVSPIGGVLAELTVAATGAGYTQLIAWATAHAPGPRLVWAVEGTRSHGTGLTRALTAVGHQVAQAPNPPAARRRRGGKSDTLDAVTAARTVLASQQLATPRADGPREDLRLLVACRRHYTDTRTATVNVFKSVILTAEDTLRAVLRGLSTARQVSYLLTHTLPGGEPTPPGPLCCWAWPARSASSTRTSPRTCASYANWSTPSCPPCSTNPVSAPSAPPPC